MAWGETMSRKKVILLIVVPVVLFTMLVAVLFAGGSEPTRSPETIPSLVPSETPSPVPGEFDGGQEAAVEHNKELDANPLLQNLPHDTKFWSLSWDGNEGGKYVVNAVVYYVVGTSPEVTVAKQRPYIEEFIRKTGQADGTYVIRYESKPVDPELS
jgi:hypothetical protein